MATLSQLSVPLQVAAAAIAGFAGVTIIFLLLFFLCSSRKKAAVSRNPQAHSASEFSSIAYLGRSLHRISMPELIAATNNFDNSAVVGDGSFGLVYKGKLADGQLVAVKKLNTDAFQGLREFEAEMETLGRVSHENIVKILGYCKSSGDRILVYEYVANGCLDQWLHGDPPTAVSTRLTWPIRVNLIRGVAAGLAYLHDGCRPKIIHRDIKASNVLLDEEFQAHIADFGLARRVDNPSHSHVSTQVAGTMGYMPPEYKDGLRATTKGDVYSFGVLMLEVATGRRPNLAVEEKENGTVKQVWLVDWARQLVGQGREMEAVDQTLIEDGLEPPSVKEFFRIACLCITDNPGERPLMADVVSMLDPV
ncbi:Leucine-rich repeat receptor protein kinase [Nymphaea thermarum]|nr:Leucine-rich repeat receptor protein kinase [Nymphaea thermarum]